MTGLGGANVARRKVEKSGFFFRGGGRVETLVNRCAQLTGYLGVFAAGPRREFRGQQTHDHPVFIRIGYRQARRMIFKPTCSCAFLVCALFRLVRGRPDFYTFPCGFALLVVRSPVLLLAALMRSRRWRVLSRLQTRQ
jgi:hypothetical protein